MADWTQNLELSDENTRQHYFGAEEISIHDPSNKPSGSVNWTRSSNIIGEPDWGSRNVFIGDIEGLKLTTGSNQGAIGGPKFSDGFETCRIEGSGIFIPEFIVDYERATKVTIGSSKSTQIQIGGIDIIEKIKKLEAENEKLKKMVDAMYYRPGMPGYDMLEANKAEELDSLEVPLME